MQTRKPFAPRLFWFLLTATIIIFVVIAVLLVSLQWSISVQVYQQKAGLDWFAITFYHNYTFFAGALFSLLLINPKVGSSQLWGTFLAIRRVFTPGSNRNGSDSTPIQNLSEMKKRSLWFSWQVLKWFFGFLFFVATGGSLVFIGNIMNPIMMAATGTGSWNNIGRIFILPFAPASGGEIVALTPSIEAQYTIMQAIILAILTIIVVRTILNLFSKLGTNTRVEWVRGFLLIIAIVVFTVIIGAPYWLMNIETPFVYGVVWTLFLSLFFGWAYLRVFGLKALEKKASRGTFFKVITVLLALVLIVQLGTIAFFSLNWNNNFLSYEFNPQTQKQITVTRWAAGLDSIQVGSISSLPTSNSSTILGLVRQWDQQAASVTMTKEIGAYNWMGLPSSEIVFLNNTEYWVSPTTPVFPSTDWISQHLIYTHASRIIVINTHSGAEVSTQQSFGVGSEPLIYYGEPTTSGEGGFGPEVYVHIPGYDEVQNVSYSGQPDYTLNGWQKTMWFIFHEGQFGFAFSNYPVDMLWNRDIFNRVGSILIPGLTIDPAAYLVSDGKSIYYALQIYIDYPLQSGFAASPYLRFFGVVLVNVYDGSMQGYTVSSIIGSNSSDFLTAYYSKYYNTWHEAPSWLEPQLRYPEQLLGTSDVQGQLDYDFLYHVNDPFVWRSGSQFYERPAGNTVQYIPWAIGDKTYFAGMQLAEFKSAASKNLAGVYIAYGGDKLGQIDLYQNPSVSTTFIGPAAAENALTTNSLVRTQLTLLPNYRIGSYLLYSVGGRLNYFVAVYTNPGTQGVVTQLPFMTAVDPATGNVGLGSDASAAYNNLLGSNQTGPPIGNVTESFMQDVISLAASKGLTVVNATSVSPTVWIQIKTLSLSANGLNDTLSQVASFLDMYGPGSTGGVLYLWTNGSSDFNIGLIKIRAGAIVELYYLTVIP